MCIKKLILLATVIVFSGCTTMTKLELTPVYDWNRVVVKDGLLYEKNTALGLYKPATGHLAEGTQDGNSTAIYIEINKEGKVMNGWSRDPKLGRKYTVINGQGELSYYDDVTGEKVRSRKVKNGRLKPEEETDFAILDFSPYPRGSQTSPALGIAAKPQDKKNNAADEHQVEPLPSCEQELATKLSKNVPTQPLLNTNIIEAPLSQPTQEAGQNPLAESGSTTHQEAGQLIPLQTVTLNNPEVKPIESTPALFTRPPPEAIAPIRNIMPSTWTPYTPTRQQRESAEATRSDSGTEKLPWIMLLALLIVSVFILFILWAILKRMKQQQQ